MKLTKEEKLVILLECFDVFSEDIKANRFSLNQTLSKISSLNLELSIHLIETLLIKHPNESFLEFEIFSEENRCEANSQMMILKSETIKKYFFQNNKSPDVFFIADLIQNKLLSEANDLFKTLENNKHINFTEFLENIINWSGVDESNYELFNKWINVIQDQAIREGIQKKSYSVFAIDFEF